MDHKKEANLETKGAKRKRKKIKVMKECDSQDRPISSNREREESF